MNSYHLVNVFTAEDGTHGNALGVFLDGAAIPAHERQAVATALGYSETVFVDRVETGELRIFTPASELPLAGHPLVGCAWVIEREHGSCQMLRPPAGDVPTWREGDQRWIRARAEWAPEMVLRQYETPEQIDALAGAPDGAGFIDCWAWIDEAGGVVRSRVFAGAQNIPEDEATGSAALRLTLTLGRPLEIRQGRGSLLHTRLGPDATVDVGGLVRHLGERPYG